MTGLCLVGQMGRNWVLVLSISSSSRFAAPVLPVLVEKLPFASRVLIRCLRSSFLSSAYVLPGPSWRQRRGQLLPRRRVNSQERMICAGAGWGWKEEGSGKSGTRENSRGRVCKSRCPRTKGVCDLRHLSDPPFEDFSLLTQLPIRQPVYLNYGHYGPLIASRSDCSFFPHPHTSLVSATPTCTDEAKPGVRRIPYKRSIPWPCSPSSFLSHHPFFLVLTSSLAIPVALSKPKHPRAGSANQGDIYTLLLYTLPLSFLRACLSLLSLLPWMPSVFVSLP